MPMPMAETPDYSPSATIQPSPIFRKSMTSVLMGAEPLVIINNCPPRTSCSCMSQLQ